MRVLPTSGQSWWCPEGFPAQVSLYKSETTEESLRRPEVSGTVRYCISLRVKVGKLLLVVLPPHQRFLHLPRVLNGVRKVTPPDEEPKIIVLSPFVLHYIDET